MAEKTLAYQPSVEEQIRLDQEGITIDQLLQYDQPSVKDLAGLSDLGFSLVDAILLTNLHTILKML